MNTIKVDRGFYTNTLTETEVCKLLDEVSILKSILLMVINKDVTWENAYEVEFNRQDAVDCIIKMNTYKGYDKEYIKTTLNKLKK